VYDAIGNLVQDVKDTITNITWNVYGKIESITQNAMLIRYTYDAAGNRISKSTTTDTTFYVRDASGNVLSVYRKPAAGQINQEEVHLYGSSRLGIVTRHLAPDSSFSLVNSFGKIYSYKFTRGEKLFELSNHLGNVLVTLSDRVQQVKVTGYTVRHYLADVRSANDYYPFGMLMPGRKFNAGSFRYGFQNQESDDEIFGEGNVVNFKYRVHDARLGRFLSVDPLNSSFPWNSPYAFSENRVIDGIELEGLEVVLVNKSKDEIIWSGGMKITDNSAIHIVAHGSQNLIVDDINGKTISKATEFKSVLKMSPHYEVQSNSGHVVAVLHSCRTGRPIIDKNGNISPSFAQKMSKELLMTVIAPDERDYFSASGEKGPFYTKSTDEGNRDYIPGTTVEQRGKSTGRSANWLVYNEGVLTGVFDGKWDPVAKPGFLDKILYKKDLSYSVSANKLNLRQGAGTSFEKNGVHLERGTELLPTGNVSNGWMEVNTPDGRKGWVDSQYTKATY